MFSLGRDCSADNRYDTTLCLIKYGLMDVVEIADVLLEFLTLKYFSHFSLVVHFSVLNTTFFSKVG